MHILLHMTIIIVGLCYFIYTCRHDIFSFFYCERLIYVARARAIAAIVVTAAPLSATLIT